MSSNCIVLGFLSKERGTRVQTKVLSIPARTGRDNNNKTAVITTAQPNSANFVHNNKCLSFKNILKLVYNNDQQYI